MKVVPYLVFNGKAEAALKFYAEALDGKILTLMRFGEHEMPGMKPEDANLIMHGEVGFGDNLIYISDTFDPEKLVVGNAYTVHLDCTSEDEIRRVFENLSQGGTIQEPLADTFWGAVYGYLTDPFGVNWSFNYQKS